MTRTETLPVANLLGEVPPLRRYARVLTCDAEQADRLVLETLISARHRPCQREQRTSLRTWLFATMHDLHNHRSDYPNREAAGSADLRRSSPISEVPAEAIESDRGRNPMLARLSRLPVEQREVLVLVAVERWGYAEIATMLGVSVGSVLATLRRARESMRP